MKPQLTQSEEMGLFVIKKVLALFRLFGVFLLYFARHWVSESDDEVNLGTHSTLVRAEHDGVRSLVVEFGLDGGKVVGGGGGGEHQLDKAHHTWCHHKKNCTDLSLALYMKCT